MDDQAAATMVSGDDFDPDVLRARYRAERDRRLRPDANDQYVEVSGDYATMSTTPMSIPASPARRCTTLWTCWWSAAASAACSRRRGGARPVSRASASSRRAATSAAPGIGTVIPAPSAISNPTSTCRCWKKPATPTQKYAFADEIRAHARRIGETFDLYRQACLQTEIRDVRWLDDESRWLITTNRDDAIRARCVAMSNGPLNRPKLPGISGIETFEGHSFHTSRWDYGYTGGSNQGDLTRLADKRVAIIGTGAMAIQCVHTSAATPSARRWREEQEMAGVSFR